MTEIDYKRLGAAIKGARLRLGLTHKTAVEAAGTGISVALWSKLENGHPGDYRPNTFAAVERALGWEFGAAARIAAGGNALGADRTPIATDGTPYGQDWEDMKVLADAWYRWRVGGGGEEPDRGEDPDAFFITASIKDNVLRERFIQLDALQAKVERLELLLEQVAERSLGPDADELPLPDESRAAE